MPDAVNRSTASQIACFGPPAEPLVSGASSGTSTGESEGAMACDQLPKKP